MGYPHPDLKKRRLKRLQKEQLDALNRQSKIMNASSKSKKNVNSNNEHLSETMSLEKVTEERQIKCNRDNNEESFRGLKSNSRNNLESMDQKPGDKMTYSSETENFSKLKISSSQFYNSNQRSGKDKSNRYKKFYLLSEKPSNIDSQ